MTRRAAAGAILMTGAWGLVDGFCVAPRPWPAAILVLAGAVLVLWDSRTGAPRALIALALQTALLPLLLVACAHLHATPLAVVAAAAARLIGLSAGVDGAGLLLVQTSSGTVAIDFSCEVAALPFVLRLGVALSTMAPRGCRAAAVAAAVLYAIARAILLALSLAGGVRMQVAWEPLWVLASFLPLALLMPRTEEPAPAHLNMPRAPRPVRAAALLALAGLSAGFAWRTPEASRPGRARILIDESRSNWEWTGTPFDNALYGQRSLYNYALWRRWIELHHDTLVLSQPPEDADLAGADILIIKTPTAPYPPETIARIERFVWRGGGLYLIGDHTNLFGMSVVLNQIARPYDIAFNFDDTFPLNHETGDTFLPGALSHPIVNGVGPYSFETSCTLTVPWSADHVIIGRRLGAEPVDYGHPNFFGDIRLQLSERFGLFVQAAGVRHGAGRVFAFSDSTNFSNFSMLWPGRRELTLRILAWLGPRKPGLAAWRAGAWWCVAAITGVAGCRSLTGGGRWALAAALWCALFAACGGAWISARAAYGQLAAPEPRAPIQMVAFDTRLGDPGLDPVSPIIGASARSGWERFNALFIDAARLGLWPATVRDLPAALRAHRRIVIVNPRRVPSEAEAAALRAWVQRGGRLLVIDSIHNRPSTAAVLLAPFGIAPVVTLRALEGDGPETAPALQAQGAPASGAAFLPGGGHAVWRTFGAGRVILAHDAAAFSDQASGGVYVAATPQREAVLRGHRDLLALLDAGTPP